MKLSRNIFLALLLVFALPLWAGRSFNGSSDIISVPVAGTPIALVGAAQMSFSYWMYIPTSVPVTEVQPMGEGSQLDGTQQWYSAVSHSGDSQQVLIHFFQSTPLNHDVIAVCPTVLSANTWYNVVATYLEGGSAVLYLNGAQCGSTTVTGVLQCAGGGCSDVPNFCVGGYAATGSPGACSTANFPGIVAEIGVWSVSLTAPEADSLYKVCPKRVLPGSLLAYWPLWGASGSSIEPDLSGNKLNGTLTGTSPANHPPCTP